MRKAFIFDMDGLLIDSERRLLACMLAAAPADCDHAALERAVRDTIGMTNAGVESVIAARMGEGFDLPACIRRAEALYFQRLEAEGVPVKPGARALLAHLAAGGYRLGLASSSPRRLVERQLGGAGLLDRFAVVISGDMVENGKPAPDIYLLACERLGIAPGEAYAVEDAPKGVLSAAAAGLAALMVPDLAPATAALRRRCHAVFQDLNELLRWVKTCESNESE
ncbi:MAG: HAD family phosphatase [Clostridia bacterium]|nr:HAD family phosphatase [Clostridia bacterium]